MTRHVVRPTYSAGAAKALETTEEQKGRLATLWAKARERAGFRDAVVARMSTGDRYGRPGWYGNTVQAATITKRRAKNKRARQARAMHRKAARR